MSAKKIEKRKSWERIVVSMDKTIATKLREYAKQERLTITGATERLLLSGMSLVEVDDKPDFNEYMVA